MINSTQCINLQNGSQIQIDVGDYIYRPNLSLTHKLIFIYAL